MKRRVLLHILFFCFLSIYAQAQLVSITPKGGINFSDFYTKTYANSSFKMGMSFGLSADYKLNKMMYFKSELGFEQKGFKFFNNVDVNGTSQIGSYYTYNYLNLPVLLKLKIGNKKNIFINSGIYAGYMISGKERFKSTVDGIYPEQKVAMNMQNRNRFDFGLALGGGFGIPFFYKKTVALELRYDFALTSPNGNGSLLFPKQHSINVTIGYEINLNR